MQKHIMTENNEVLPHLDELCKHKLTARYGSSVNNAFTINHAFELLESKNIHLSRKTVERRLDALTRLGLLDGFMSGKQKAYVRAK